MIQNLCQATQQAHKYQNQISKQHLVDQITLHHLQPIILPHVFLALIFSTFFKFSMQIVEDAATIY